MSDITKALEILSLPETGTSHRLLGWKNQEEN
jgi:hypothetical protein